MALPRPSPRAPCTRRVARRPPGSNVVPRSSARQLHDGRTEITIAPSCSSTASTTVFSNPNNRAHARTPTLRLRTSPLPFNVPDPEKPGTVEAARRAPSCPEVGRSQRPDLPSPKRGTAAAVNQRETAANNRNPREHRPRLRRWLTDDDSRATRPPPLSLHPQKRQ